MLLVDMGDKNRIAKGIVLVPCLLLGSAFFFEAIWGREISQESRIFISIIGLILIIAGVLTQFLPSKLENRQSNNSKQPPL